jgi:hypothetical protein
MTILLGDFNAKIGREDIFKLTIGNESIQATSNDNGVLSSQLCHMQKSHCHKYNVHTS